MPTARGQSGLQQVSARRHAGRHRGRRRSARNLDVKPYVDVESDDRTSTRLRACRTIRSARRRPRREVRRHAEPRRPTSPSTPTSRRSRPTSSRSTSRASACSFPRSASSSSRTRAPSAFGGVAVGRHHGGDTATRRSCSTAAASASIDGQRGADRRGRPADRARRAVQHRRAQHPDRRRAGSRGAVARTSRVRAPEARLPPAEQHRAAVHQVAPSRRTGTGGNRSYGIDGTFGFFENLHDQHLLGAHEHRRTATGDDTSYRAQLDYPGDRYGVQVERLAIGDDFNPEVGFVRRDDMVRDFAQLRFSPRPRRHARRSASSSTGLARLHRERRRPARDARARRRVRDRVPERRSLQRHLHEHLRVPAGARFRIAPSVDAAGRRLRFRQRSASRYNMGQQRRGLGQRVGGVRHVLQRPQDDDRRRAAGAMDAHDRSSRSSRPTRSTASICRRGRSPRTSPDRASPTR